MYSKIIDIHPLIFFIQTRLCLFFKYITTRGKALLNLPTLGNVPIK